MVVGIPGLSGCGQFGLPNLLTTEAFLRGQIGSLAYFVPILPPHLVSDTLSTPRLFIYAFIYAVVCLLMYIIAKIVYGV